MEYLCVWTTSTCAANCCGCVVAFELRGWDEVLDEVGMCVGGLSVCYERVNVGWSLCGFFLGGCCNGGTVIGVWFALFE